MTYDPRVRIHCVFGWDPNEDHPELLEAWDEFDVDANPEGFKAAWEEAVRLRQIPERYVRHVRLVVDWDKVEALYHDVEIDAGVEQE